MILDVIVEDKKKKLKEHKNRISEEKMKELAFACERKAFLFMKRWQSRDCLSSESLKRLLQVWER